MVFQHIMFHHIGSCKTLRLILLLLCFNVLLLFVAPRDFNHDWDSLVLVLYKKNNLPQRTHNLNRQAIWGGMGYNMQTYNRIMWWLKGELWWWFLLFFKLLSGIISYLFPVWWWWLLNRIYFLNTWQSFSEGRRWRHGLIFFLNMGWFLTILLVLIMSPGIARNSQLKSASS